MEWLNVTAEQGLSGLFFASFLASTVLPGGSEALLWLFLGAHPEQATAALILVTVGNTLGGLSSWGCGRLLPVTHDARFERALAGVRRWGAPALLLSWLPLLGDALCVAAGWLRLHWLPCTLAMALGKGVRYLLVAQASGVF